ncbi:unnamed protein product [Arctogadus glacialis]
MYWVQRDSLAVSYTCPDCQSRLEQDPQDQCGPPGPDPPHGAGRRPSSAHTHPSQPPPPQQSVSGQTPQLRSAHSFPSRPTSVSISSSTLPRVETLITKKPKKPQRRQMNNRLKPLTLAYDGDADM